MFRFLKRLFAVSTGDVIEVQNTGKHRAANEVYYAARLRTRWGNDGECFLFTEHELLSARNRALKNPEDVPWCDPENCECSR